MNMPPDSYKRQLGPGGLEMRALPIGLATVRAAGDDDAPMISGLGSVANTVTRIGGDYGFDELFEAGNWTETIKTADVRAMFNHDTNWLLGRTKSGSLRLAETNEGHLAYDIDVNQDDPNAMSVHARVKRGDVDGSSVWFRVLRDEWTYPDEDSALEVPQRRILESALIETGPVTFPAYEAATSSARSLAPFDAVLRAAGVRDHQRAMLTADLLSDPDAAHEALRRLFAKVPDLREQVCACETPGPAATAAPADERAATAAQEPETRTSPLDAAKARLRLLEVSAPA